MDKIALIDDKGRSYTYEQLNMEQCNFAKLINADCLMFLVCTNTIECIVAYVSCIHNKFPVLLVDKNILPERYENAYYSLLKNSDIYEGSSMYKELALLISTSGSSGSNKHVSIL